MHPTTKNAMDNHIESKALFYTDWYILKLMSDIIFYIFTLHITVLIFVFYHFIKLILLKSHRFHQALVKLLCRVVAHALLSVIHSSNLDNNREITTGGYG